MTDHTCNGDAEAISFVAYHRTPERRDGDPGRYLGGGSRGEARTTIAHHLRAVRANGWSVNTQMRGSWWTISGTDDRRATDVYITLDFTDTAESIS